MTCNSKTLNIYLKGNFLPHALTTAKFAKKKKKKIKYITIKDNLWGKKEKKKEKKSLAPQFSEDEICEPSSVEWRWSIESRLSGGVMIFGHR